MTTTTQERPRRIGRAVSLALAASLAIFALTPGAAFAAGETATATQAAGSDCSTGTFNWTVSLGGFATGDTVMVEATLGSNYHGEPLAITGNPTTVTFALGGSSTDTLNVTVSDMGFNPIATATATPSCAPPAPAVPTAKSQCDGNGWASFPGMKNRGACVAFVSKGK